MQEDKRSARQQTQHDAPRNGKCNSDTGHRASGMLRFSKTKDAFQRQSSTSTVVQETRRRSSNRLSRKDSDYLKDPGVDERCPIPKTPSMGHLPSGGTAQAQQESLEFFQMYQPCPEQRFSTEEAKTVIKSLVDARLGEARYGPGCSDLARDLADSVRDAAKARLCDRYKLICFVVIGQVKDCDVTCVSRGVWSPTADTFVEYIFKNDSLFALCILYAVYQE